MEVIITSHSTDPPKIVATVTIENGEIKAEPADFFDRLSLLGPWLPQDSGGFVPFNQPERFLRALPRSLTGSHLRARLKT